jgi:hypothetical protein
MSSASIFDLSASEKLQLSKIYGTTLRRSQRLCLSTTGKSRSWRVEKRIW